jgi:hypothetical protein
MMFESEPDSAGHAPVAQVDRAPDS